MFSDRQDAKLLMLLEQQYIQGNQEPTDLQDMKKDFMERDKCGEGTLTKENVCSCHHLIFKNKIFKTNYY